MPILDYAHPLHTFMSGSLTYTTTQKCWLFGMVNAGGGNAFTITIDGSKLFYASPTGCTGLFLIPLNAGSTIVSSGQMSALSVYLEADPL